MKICRYCGGVIRLVPASSIYGESAERLGMSQEWLHQCQNCNARVGCHKGTKRPLGNVANEVLRLKRMETHVHLMGQTASTYPPKGGKDRPRAPLHQAGRQHLFGYAAGGYGA